MKTDNQDRFGIPTKRESKWLDKCAKFGGVIRTHSERGWSFSYANGRDLCK